MLFNSYTFVAFFLVVFGVYYLPWMRSWQVLFLTAASLVFYAYDQPRLVLLLLLSILINATSSYGVICSERRALRLFWAWVGVLANLGVLIFFKYGPLVGRTLGLEAAPDGSMGYLLIHMPLPIGISFFTFQGISLVVDAYRRADATIEQLAHGSVWLHFRDTAFFKAFFPQLVAGPIVKAHDFYHQIKPKRFDEISWERALTAVLMGYFLKVVVADNLKDLSFWISFPYYRSLSTWTLLALVFGYSIQIFADFAGYSLIAIGIARLFGYELIQNFDYPYISQSLSEFWRRWHISLSTWLREYLYIPLGGNRRGPIRTYVNLVLVMVLGGLWHGAAWSYAVWGLYHGLGLALERLVRRDARASDEAFSVLRCVFVFGFVSAGWLLFKLPEFSQVLDFCVTLTRNTGMEPDWMQVFCVLAYAVPVLGYHLFYLRGKHRGETPGAWTKAVVYGLCLFLLLTNAGSAGAFIYFQF